MIYDEGDRDSSNKKARATLEIELNDASERSHARMARWKTFLNRYDFVPEEAIWPAVATDLQHERSRPGVVDKTLSRQLYFFLVASHQSTTGIT